MSNIPLKTMDRFSDRTALFVAFLCSFGNCSTAFFLNHRWASLWLAPVWFVAQLLAFGALSKCLELPRQSTGKTILVANTGMGTCLVIGLIGYTISLVPGIAMIVFMIAGLMGLLQLFTLAWFAASAFSLLYLPVSALRQAKAVKRRVSLTASIAALIPFVLIVGVGFSGVLRQVLSASGMANAFFSTAARVSGDEDVCAKANHPWECFETLAQKQKRPEICLKINMTGGPESCLEKYAQTVSSAEDCQKLDSIISKATPQFGVRARLERAGETCLSRFPGTVQTSKQCEQAWLNHEEARFMQLKCYRMKSVARIFPGTLAAYAWGPDLEEFLRFNPDLSARDPEGRTVLHLLQHDGSLPRLLQAGADPNLKDKQEQTAPMLWVTAGYIFMVSRTNGNLDALQKSHWNPNLADAFGDSVLHKIAKSPELHSKSGRNYDFEEKTIAELINSGADPALKNVDGKTPKDIALERQLIGLFP